MEVTDGNGSTLTINGKAKLYVAVIAFLWSSLVGVGAFAWGGKSQAAALDAHEVVDGHPVMVERVGRLEVDILARLQSIDARLANIEGRD